MRAVTARKAVASVVLLICYGLVLTFAFVGKWSEATFFLVMSLIISPQVGD